MRTPKSSPPILHLLAAFSRTINYFATRQRTFYQPLSGPFYVYTRFGGGGPCTARLSMEYTALISILSPSGDKYIRPASAWQSLKSPSRLVKRDSKAPVRCRGLADFRALGNW